MPSLEQKLSDHFLLKELCYTSHRTIDNTPPDEVVTRLRLLSWKVLEPIREEFGAVRVNSGYRCPELNKKIGGAKDSAHLYGVAADIDLISNDRKLQEVVNWVLDSELDFDQIILESSSTANWIHIGSLRPDHEKVPRRQALRFKNGTYTVYDRKTNYGV